MRKQAEREIDGLRATSTQLPLRESLQLQATLIKQAMPVMANLGSDETFDKRASALPLVLADLSEADHWKLVCRILAATQFVGPDGKIVECSTQAKIEAGVPSVPTLYRLVQFALDVNFADAFREIFGAPPAATEINDKPETAQP